MESASSDTPVIHPDDDDEIGLGDDKSDLISAMEAEGSEKSVSDFNKIHRNREVGDISERPTSLRLESVLEYTNRIKSFLGLHDEEKESGENIPEDSEKTEGDTDHEDNSGKYKDSDEKLSSIDENFDAENSHSGTEELTSANDEFIYSKLTPQPLPDIIGIQPDTLEEAEHEPFPDVLERSKNFEIEKPEDISEKDSSSEINEDQLTFNSNNDNDLHDAKKYLTSGDVTPQNGTASEEESLPKTKSESGTNSADVKNADFSDIDDERNITQRDANSSFGKICKESEMESEVPTLEQKLAQFKNIDKTGKIQNKEDSDDETPYQITHIEEGLRQAEKSSKSALTQASDQTQTLFKKLSQEPGEQKTMFKDDSQVPDEQKTMSNDNSQESCEQQAMITDDSQEQGEQQTMLENSDDRKQNIPCDTNPPVLLTRKSKLSMEDIRRLSTEVVNSILETAGDEVKVIWQNRDSASEENKPSETTDFESPDDEELIASLQDTGVELPCGKLEEISLADIPEEKPVRTFSNTTDISRESVATSATIKSIPVGSKHSIDSIDRIEVTDEIDFDTQCGIGPFKPQCIQRFATANVYVILYSIIGILHGSYYTYLVGVLTTLEKRFEFKSKTSGFIMMLDELTPLFLGVLIGHFGGRAHRPRLLSFGMFLSAFCCFASALPYFLYGTATHLSVVRDVHNKTSAEMCNGDVRIEHCDTDDRPPTVTAILLLMLGSFLKGFGNLAYYAIGLAYLDDNAKKRNTPLYFAVAFALRLLGPMVGFLMSSAFLKYYENPFVTPDFGPDDPRWIGGWWMGFTLQGALLLIFAGPMALFPRRLPDHRPLMHEIEHNSNISMFDGLGDSLKRLARNPLYMLIGLNTIFTVYGNFGYYIMLPKYMENQFRLSASSASLFAGPPGIAALMVSCIMGGYLIWRFKPTARFLAGGLVILELISTVGYLLLMIPQCEKIEMTHFGLGDDGLMLEGGCNLNCSCSTVQFTPVCGPDGKSYFSPCYAGCSFQKDQSFYNCSCVKDSEIAVVTKGVCTSENCWSQALAYIVTLPVLQFFVNILRVAYTMIMLRSIKPEDKNIALGVFETVLSTVAFIPFPVLYGALVDSACLVWEKSCGETGNCWFYDIQKFNYLMHGGSAFFCGLSTLTLVAIFFLVNRIKDLYTDEEGEGDKGKKTNLKP